MSEYLGLVIERREKIPEILHPASRQYRHNDGTPGLVPGFDFDETIAIVKGLQARIQAAMEVYAGMEGFIPETASEGYYLRIIEQMNEALQESDDERV